MPTDDRQPSSWFPWVVVAILGYMLWQKQPAPQPEPVVPTVTVEQVAAKLIKDTSDGYARVFSEAATKVQSKELTTEEALATLLKKELKDVRENASAEFDKLLDVNIPTEFSDGNRGAVETFLRQSSKGFSLQ